MIRRSGSRFFEKIMLRQADRSRSAIRSDWIAR